MRKFITLFLTLLLLSSTIVFAHPGGTDGAGGHKNHSTGEYHYHHGYSAHQHTDGVCPYDFNDNTNDEETNYFYDEETNEVYDEYGNRYETYSSEEFLEEYLENHPIETEDDDLQERSSVKESPIKDVLSTIFEYVGAFVVLYLGLFAFAYSGEFFRKVLDFIKKKK